MSRPTFDLARIRREALAKFGTSQSTTDWLKRWWCDKYDRPINDSALQTLSHGALLRELMFDMAKKREELIGLSKGDARGQDMAGILQSLANIEDFLGISKKDASPILTGDPVVDEWERELAAGRIPESLTKGIVKSRSGTQTEENILSELMGTRRGR